MIHIVQVDHNNTNIFKWIWGDGRRTTQYGADIKEEVFDWCNEYAGWGNWGENISRLPDGPSFHEFVFMDLGVAVLFKLTWC